MAIPRAALQRLKDAAWLKNEDTRSVFALLDGGAGKTRVVGGAVRDTLADRVRETQDVDFATELLPEDVLKPCPPIQPGSSTARLPCGRVRWWRK
jgi:tRNA nucleotidyltransferase/poly(A) polymerase